MRGFRSILVFAAVWGTPLAAVAGEKDDAVKAAIAAVVDQLGPVLEKRKGICAIPPVRAAAEAEELGLGPVFTKALIRGMKDAGYNIRDADAVRKVLGEAADAGGLSGDIGALDKISQALGAKTILVGQIGALNDSLTLDVKAVDPSSAEVIAAANAKIDLWLFRPKGAKRTRPFAGGGSDQSVEIALRRLADEIAINMRKEAGDDFDLRFLRGAVLPFHEKGEGALDNELGTVVPTELATNLRRDHGILLTERQQIKSVLSEQALGQTGVIDPSSAAQVGEILGVDFLVVGEVSAVGDHYRVNARVVDAESGDVITAASISLPAEGLIALSSDSIVLRSRSGAFFRSMLLPGWGQFYNRESFKGTFFLGGEAALLGTALAFHFLGAQAETDYHLPEVEFRAKYENDRSCATPPPERSCLTSMALELRLTAEQNYRTRNTFLIVAGGLWAYNLLDAYINGPSVGGGGGAIAVVPTENGVGVVAAITW